jgi:hypothetical protein
MTLAAFHKASVILFPLAKVVKAGVVRAILDPKTETEKGRVIWFLDRAAAAELPIH